MSKNNLVVFYSPFDISRDEFCIEFFRAYFEKYISTSVIFCSGNPDRRERKMMTEADLVVVGINQDYRLLDEYFMENIVSNENIIYLVLDYMGAAKPDVREIQRRYRIDKNRLVVIPYNIRYKNAIFYGRHRAYLNLKYQDSSYEKYTDFRKQLNRAGRICLKAMMESKYY